MTSKSTKRALLSSTLAILMCVAMLIGTTFAWFTDTASTAVNKIQSGTLKVDIVKEDGVTSIKNESMSFVNKDGSANILWEPGATFMTPAFKIKSTGSLALKYKLTLNGITGDNMLLDVITFSVVKADGTEVALDTFVGHLTPDAALSDALYIKGHMDEAAGNDYQNKTLEGLGITVVATQDTVENDSYDNQYDKDAPYEIVKVSDEKELRTALFNAPTDGSGVKIVMQDDITLDMYYSALLFAHSNTADKWQHSGGLSAEDAAIEAAKPENNEVPDYSTAYDTLAHYKTAVNGWDTVSSNLAEQAKFGANFPMSATNPVSRLVVKPGQDVIIDLNGHKLTKNANATHGDWTDVCTSLIGNYGTLSIIDSKGTGLITGSGMKSCSGGVIHNYGGELTIKGVYINGGADYTEDHLGQYVIVNGDQSGTIVLDGAYIYDGATSASLICNNAGTMTIKNETELKHANTKVINCKGGEVFVESAEIWSDVYAIYAKGGTVTVTDSAVIINGNGTMTAEGGTIIHQ